MSDLLKQEQVCTVGCYGNRHTRREMNTGTQPEQNTELWTRTGLLKVSEPYTACAHHVLNYTFIIKTGIICKRGTFCVQKCRLSLRALEGSAQLQSLVPQGKGFIVVNLHDFPLPCDYLSNLHRRAYLCESSERRTLTMNTFTRFIHHTHRPKESSAN